MFSTTYISSPLQEVHMPLFERHDVRLLVKREDALHPIVSGNKWRKLKYNLIHHPEGVITYGGAFSNHIHATAGAGKYLNIPTVGIIRGEYDPQNPTLVAAQAMGMKLHFVTRSDYKQKEESSSIRAIIERYPDYTCVPEGGSNDLALIGLEELALDIASIDFDVLALAAGTGATARGIIPYMIDREVLIFSALKGSNLHHEFGIIPNPNHRIIDTYHCGGYGRTSPDLIQSINTFYTQTGIPVDPVYNGKTIYGLCDMVAQGQYKNKTILWIHSGGLQGIDGYNYLAQKKGNTSLIITG